MGRRATRVLTIVIIVTTLGSCTWFFALFNYMDIDGIRYDLGKMHVFEWTDVENGFSFYYGSRGLIVEGVNGAELTGSGDVLVLTVVSGSAQIDDGTYRFDQEGGFGVAPLFSLAVVGHDSDEPDSGECYFVGGGSIALRSTAGGGYVVEFDLLGGPEDEVATDPLVFPTSLAMTGRYRGEVTDYFVAALFGSTEEVRLDR